MIIAALAAHTAGGTAWATEYVQVLNADAFAGGSGIYAGTAAGPTGLGSYWNKWVGDGTSQPAVLTNAQVQSTAATIQLTKTVIGSGGDANAVIQVSGAAALNKGFKWVKTGLVGYDTFEFQVKALPASTNGNGKWDVYLYLNIDSGQSASFTATSGSATVSDTIGSTAQASWVEGDSFWVLRDLTPLNGTTLTVSVQATGPSFLWLNGVQLAEQKGNRAPIAYDQSLTGYQGVAKNITLTATDLNNDAINYTVLTQPAHGSLSGTPPNLAYTSRGAYLGADSFTFKVNDGQLDSNTGTVSVAVIAASTRLINVDIQSPVYTGSAAGPTGLGSTWNVGVSVPNLIDAQGASTGSSLTMTHSYNGAFGNLLPLGYCAVDVPGAANLCHDWGYVSYGNYMEFQFSSLTASPSGTGVWDLYLYVNTDSAIATFAATATGLSATSITNQLGWNWPRTSWVEGSSYYVIRNLVPSSGSLTVKVTEADLVSGRYIWLNGMQLAEQKVAPKTASGTVVLLR